MEVDGHHDWPLPTSHGASILVVEDDEELAGVVGQRLQQEGFVVVTVLDGESALDVLASTHVDAVVLDLMLPGVGGVQLCRQLRQQRRRVPVVMTSALAGLDDRMAGFGAGADDYLVKPFDLAEMVARLRAVLWRDQGHDMSYLAVGDLHADVMTRRAWRGQSEIDLTPREFAVFELFLRHPGVVLTRRTILGAVWGRKATPSENVVDQYVAHLRRKIDRPFGRSDLQTLHRVGWRLQVAEQG